MKIQYLGFLPIILLAVAVLTMMIQDAIDGNEEEKEALLFSTLFLSVLGGLIWALS